MQVGIEMEVNMRNMNLSRIVIVGCVIALCATSALANDWPQWRGANRDGKVVTLGVGGVVSCLDAASGKMIWRKDPYTGVVPKFFTSCSPIIIDGMAVVQLGAAGNGAIVAFDLDTGGEK